MYVWVQSVDGTVTRPDLSKKGTKLEDHMIHMVTWSTWHVIYSGSWQCYMALTTSVRRLAVNDPTQFTLYKPQPNHKVNQEPPNVAVSVLPPIGIISIALRCNGRQVARHYDLNRLLMLHDKLRYVFPLFCVTISCMRKVFIFVTFYETNGYSTFIIWQISSVWYWSGQFIFCLIIH